MNIADRISRFSPLRRHARFWLNTVLGMIMLPLAAVSAPSGGNYTRDQAQIGAQIYSGTCSVCHGSRLQGAPRRP